MTTNPTPAAVRMEQALGVLHAQVQDHDTAADIVAKVRARIGEIEAAVENLREALQSIERQCEIADDPEHHTLGLVKHIARAALRSICAGVEKSIASRSKE